ncbi:MAG: hypothetical protein IJT32_07080 [Lachnospiraceae bacterium]|nr:hypothetical protein [Lachnospiraceae bacterium]
MLNEKRVRHMIRMAMYEKYESHDYNKMQNTTKKDYVSFHDTLGTIAGTVLYLLLAGGIAVALYTLFLEDVTQVVVILFAIAALIGYIVFLYVYRRLVHRRTMRRYAIAKRKVNRINKDWDVLEQLYEEEADRAVPQAYEPGRSGA